ncbi:hypothetical protein PVK06_030591 [Gossypium arboreum]|uniref:MULE transposase domain-containing protein n=1 Tax=Gossypium arboreum TaxID=29729 RepID=A0ABR0NPL8_GOSAR|nr:hypothetical protein PVK06_030591 [Gossypium arboreum]
MRFNRNISFNIMKERISAKNVRRCGRRISKLFYKFPVSTDPVKFIEMELVDDEDVETMFALYYENRSDQNAPIHLFAKLASVEPTKDLTLYGEEHGAQEPCIVAPISYVDSESTIHGIDIDLNVAPDTDVVDETWLSGKYTQIILLAVAQDENKNVLPIAFSIIDKVNMELWEFFLTNLQSYILQVGYLDAKNKSATSQPDGGGTLVCRGCQGCNGCKMRFQTLHYPCAQVMAACDKVSLNVEQFVDDMYTLEHMLRVWENEFLVLPNLFIWEVPLMTFELIPNQGLRRNLKGRPQSSRIHNEIDIREKFNGGGVLNMEEKLYAPNAIDELEQGGVLYCCGYDPGGVE